MPTFVCWHFRGQLSLLNERIPCTMEIMPACSSNCSFQQNYKCLHFDEGHHHWLILRAQLFLLATKCHQQVPLFRNTIFDLSSSILNMIHRVSGGWSSDIFRQTVLLNSLRSAHSQIYKVFPFIVCCSNCLVRCYENSLLCSERRWHQQAPMAPMRFW